MTDPRLLLRAWLLAMDRFELHLRVKAARDRNSFVREAAHAYGENGTAPGWLDERHRRRVTATLADHYAAVAPYFAAAARRQVEARRGGRKQAGRFQAHMYEWVGREAVRKARLIAATDAADVRGVIQDGLAEGLGTEEIARAIGRVSSLTRRRASVIARTETHAAATYGSIEAVRDAEHELGVRLLKQWLPTLDDRTRPDHAAMAGSDPIPLDEKFAVGGVMMDRPGDPAAPPELTISCRCALIYTEATD